MSKDDNPSDQVVNKEGVNPGVVQADTNEEALPRELRIPPRI